MCLRRQCVPRVSFHNRSRTLINASMIMGLDLSRLFLVSHFIYFLFIPCGRLSWLSVSVLLHVKYTLSYRVVLCRKYIDTQTVSESGAIRRVFPVNELRDCIALTHQRTSPSRCSCRLESVDRDQATTNRRSCKWSREQ